MRFTYLAPNSKHTAMFEAFRCTRPLSRAGGQTGQSAPSPVQPATSQTAKRRRRDGGSSSSSISPVEATAGAGAGGRAAAAAAAQQQAPSTAAAGQGLASEKMGDAPLRLVIVGHNPSAHAWSSGHFYSNSSNWMWKVLRETGIAPPDAISGAADDGKMPAVAGVGFTDVGSGTPGTDSSQFSSQHFAQWRPGFFNRLAQQAKRASSAVPGCTCGTCGAPLLVAFSGKRQFVELFAQPAGGGRGRGKGGGRGGAAGSGTTPAAAAGGNPAERIGSWAVSESGSEVAALVPTLQARRPSSVAAGRQWVLPQGWPLPLCTEVWVMSSTSGAAPMTREQRFGPWQALALRMQQEPWPRQARALCDGGGGEGSGGEGNGRGAEGGGS